MYIAAIVQSYVIAIFCHFGLLYARATFHIAVYYVDGRWQIGYIHRVPRHTIPPSGQVHVPQSPLLCKSHRNYIQVSHCCTQAAIRHIYM